MRISLFCVGGMSTSLLIKKMRDSAAARGKDYNINAYPLNEFEGKAPGSDVCLLGPQVAYAYGKLCDAYPDFRIAVVPTQMYGLMDGKGVVSFAEKLIGEE
jgi:PTS system cellobiose-specific IIB component